MTSCTMRWAKALSGGLPLVSTDKDHEDEHPNDGAVSATPAVTRSRKGQLDTPCSTVQYWAKKALSPRGHLCGCLGGRAMAGASVPLPDLT